MRTDALRRDERGMVSALGLVMLMAALLLALGTLHFTRGAAVIATEYERETQLRLAAAGGGNFPSGMFP